MRAHNLIPSVYHPYQPAGTEKTACAAEGVQEGGVGREVGFDCLALGGGRGLG